MPLINDMLSPQDATPQAMRVTPRLSTPAPVMPAWSDTADPALQAVLDNYLANPPQQPEAIPTASPIQARLTPYDVSQPDAPAKYMGEWKQRSLYNAGVEQQNAQQGKFFNAQQKQYDQQIGTLQNVGKSGGLGMGAYGFRGTTGTSRTRGSAPMGFQPQMWSALNRAFDAMQAAGLGRPKITDGFRSYAAQVAVKAKKGNLAATPGRSIHGLGLAADLDLSARQQRWLEANSRQFGLVRLKSEPWHWQLVPKMWSGRWGA